MSKVDELLKEILEETKRQVESRKEYIELIHNLLESSTREDDDGSLKWQLFFQMNNARSSIFCSSHIIERHDGLKATDEESMTHYYKEMDEAINYLFDHDKIDEFVEFLSNKAIPLFLQDRHAPWYKI